MIYAIGNGESRKPVNLSRLKDKKIGCNAIFRDSKVDQLVCVDRRMISEALKAKVNTDTYIYTRPDWFSQFKTKKIRIVPELPYAGSERADNPFQWGSGPYAVLIAAYQSRFEGQQVGLIGFDLYSNDSKINNIYKDTENYDSSQKRAVDPRYWIYQIGKVIEYFPDVSFISYQPDGWQMPSSWKKSNHRLDNISNIV